MNSKVETKSIRLINQTDKPKTENQLISELEKAEKGYFISVEEGMKDFEEWLQTREWWFSKCICKIKHAK